MPYVYIGIHKITGEIYVGYREKNVQLKRTSDVDLFLYRTSSKTVRPAFDEYDWYIIAEFFTGSDAYDFEQALIYEYWGNPLLLNKNCRHGSKSRFKSQKGTGKGRVQTAEHRAKNSAANKGKTKGNKYGPASAETRAKQSLAGKGKPKPEGFGAKISATLKGRSSGRKGIVSSKKGVSHTVLTCPHCNKSGGQSNMIRYHFENCRDIVDRAVEKRPAVICPHCQKEGGNNVMVRWHFDNCKFRTN